MTYSDHILTYSYITGGVTYTLNGTNTITTRLGSESFTFSYLGDQGFGLAPLHRITTRGPLQHGDSDIDFRLDPRILQIPLLIKNESAGAPKARHYSIREALLNIFNPNSSGVLRVRIGTTDGTTATVIDYQINVKVLGGLTFDVDPTSYNVRTVVQLRADDPTWYDATLPAGVVRTYNDANVGGTQIFVIPGNWPTFPIIRVNGPMKDTNITNNTTGQRIEIGGTIAAGAWYEIDLSYGKKTVVDNFGANRISDVSASSNLATWSLVPGSNTIAITSTIATAASSDIRFTYFPRYTGI